MAVKSGVATGYTVGTVLEIDGNNIALVRMKTGQQKRIRADMLRGKSLPPQPGETWLFDQPYGTGWMFAVCMNYLGGDRSVTTPTLGNSWASAGGSYAPVGYIKDGAGWVQLQGRLTGGTSNTVAFMLPAGYRPGYLIPFVVNVGTGTGIVTVGADGSVTPVGSGAASLEQVRFMAQG